MIVEDDENLIVIKLLESTQESASILKKWVKYRSFASPLLVLYNHFDGPQSTNNNNNYTSGMPEFYSF